MYVFYHKAQRKAIVEAVAAAHAGDTDGLKEAERRIGHHNENMRYARFRIFYNHVPPRPPHHWQTSRCNENSRRD